MAQRIGNKTSKMLTSLVLEYKLTKNECLLKDINNLSKGLLGPVYKYYGMLKFPSLIIEEITEDCCSHILLKAIEAFDATKRTEFSTFYTWRLKSYVRARRNFYIRRSALALQTSSLDAPVGKGLHSVYTQNLHEFTTKSSYNYRAMGEFKRTMSDIFNLT